MSTSKNRSLKLAATTAAGAMALALAAPAQAIVPNDNFTPDDIIDDTGANGVGMFFRNDGFVCSGTLINPRTVLFAAHCVNDRPESDYGTIIRSAFSFDDNALPGFISWISNGFSSFPDQFVYDIAQIQYDPRSLADPNAFGFLEADIALATLATPVSSQFDPNSQALVSTIPMWALLFSPLPTPAAIDPVDGTGYHVNITGYGRSGSGTTGASQGIDWRRRAAENMLGALTSFDERNIFLFGNPFGDLPQSLYRLDFDDPNKTNPFDFNLYKDEPRVMEGTTAGGDSGGPLILDAANNTLSTENLQIGVLSGGSRFFGPQVFSSYGTESFYQPLYLYWDYIVANNPYRYVSAVAGDGNWEDPTHWQTDLDPIYRIIDDNGAVVNGLPTSAGLGPEGGSPDFGEVCFDPEGANPGDACQDLATGNATPPARNIVGGNTVSGIGRANLDANPNSGLVQTGVPGNDAQASASPVPNGADNDAQASADLLPNGAENEAQAAAATAPGARAGMIAGSEHQAQNNGGMIAGGENMAFSNGVGVDFAIEAPHTGVDLAEEQAQDDEGEEQPQGINGGGPEFADTPNPAPTIDNGLPGATNFVPNNVNADVANGVNGRYYDVTLNQAGTTTLSSTVIIDRLNISGAAGLNVAGAGDLTSLIDIQQAGGMVNVDGTLATPGDYLMIAGLLSGTGTVRTPFLTSITGMIAPGTMGTVGTLNLDGNLVLSSGSSLLIDLGDGAPLPVNGVSDRLTVTGAANVGGSIGFAVAPGTTPALGDQYLILTAANGVTGTFTNVGSLSAILQPVVTYGPNAVRVWISANQYRDVIDRTSPVQVSYADLLDDNRYNGTLADIFAVLDYVPTGAEIGAILQSWAPTPEATVRALGASTLTHLSGFHQNRMVLADRGSNGGTLAMVGNPVQTAALASSGMIGPNGSAIQSDVAMTAAAAAQGGSRAVSNDLNEDIAVYIAGGFINGQSNAMRTVQNFRDDDFDGFFLAGGLEYYVGENAMIGASIYYSDLDADAALNNAAENDTLVGTVYGRAEFGRWGVDGQFSIGNFSAETLRRVSLGAATQTLVTSDDSTLIAAEGSIDYALPFVGSTTINPGIGLRYHNINFGPITETGGSLALNINRRDYHSFQGTAGLEVVTNPHAPFEARLSALFVHDFNRQPATFQGNFAAGASPFSAPFALGGRDRNWVELSAGLRLNRGNMSFDLAAHTTVERNTVDSQAFTAGVSFRF